MEVLWRHEETSWIQSVYVVGDPEDLPSGVSVKVVSRRGTKLQTFDH